MHSFDSISNQTGLWTHAKNKKNQFELRVNHGLFAQVTCSGGLFEHAHAETYYGAWDIERRQRAMVSIQEGPRQDIAELLLEKRGTARLSFKSGSIYSWSRTSFWRDVWKWADIQGETLLTLTRGRRVQWLPSSIPTIELAVLTICGWHRHIQLEMESAFIAGIVTTTVTTSS